MLRCRRVIDELSDDLLLLTATREGELAIPAKMRFGLAGAEVVRFAAAGRVGIAGGRIVVRDAAPTGDSLLDAALASMRGAGAGRPRRPGSPATAAGWSGGTWPGRQPPGSSAGPGDARRSGCSR
jgi:hypothetical protein